MMTKDVYPQEKGFVCLNLVFYMRACGSFILLIGVTELGVGGTAFGFLSNMKLGSWWGAILPIIAGILSMLSYPRRVIIAGFIASLLSIVTATVGAVIDSMGANILEKQVVCYSPYSSIYYGHLQPNYVYASKTCSESNPSMSCACVTVSTDTPDCTYYNGQTDCEVLMTQYLDIIKASSALLSLLALLSLVNALLAFLVAFVMHSNASESSDSLLLHKDTTFISTDPIHTLEHDNNIVI